MNEWTKRLLTKLGLRHDDNAALLNLYHNNLAATYLRYDSQTGDRDAAAPAVREEIERLLAEDEAGRSWSNAYKAEQLIFELAPAPELRAEFVKHLADAEGFALPQAAAFRAEFEALYPKGTTELPQKKLAEARSLLVRIVNDTQWAYTQRYRRRRLLQFYGVRITVLFALISLLFLFTLWMFSQYQLAHFYGYLAAISSGLLGAAFSILTGRQTIAQIGSLEALQSATGLGMSALRLGVGGGAAAILYFLFDSGLVDISIFPKLVDIGFTEVAPQSGEGTAMACEGGCRVPNEALSSLIVWGFAAGFFEKLVPKMLHSGVGGEDRFDPVDPAARK